MVRGNGAGSQGTGTPSLATPMIVGEAASSAVSAGSTTSGLTSTRRWGSLLVPPLRQKQNCRIEIWPFILVFFSHLPVLNLYISIHLHSNPGQRQRRERWCWPIWRLATSGLRLLVGCREGERWQDAIYVDDWVSLQYMYILTCNSVLNCFSEAICLFLIVQCWLVPILFPWNQDWECR